MKKILYLFLIFPSLLFSQQEQVTKTKSGGRVLAVTVGVDSVLLRVNVLDFGIKNDSTTQTEGALTQLVNALNEDGKRLFFPAGVYLFSRQDSLGLGLGYVFNVQGNNVSVEFAAGARVYFPTTSSDVLPSNLFMLTGGVDGFELTGGRFYGNQAVVDDIGKSVVYAHTGATNVKIHNCFFESVSPFGNTSNVANRGLWFQNNKINNQPASLNPVFDSFIDNCIWDNDTLNNERSHSVYAYGIYGELKVTNCTFRNNGNGSYGFKYRADGAVFQQKRDIVISNNYFENNQQAGIELASSEDVYVSGVTITGNTFRNSIGVRAYSCAGCAITGNTFLTDHRGDKDFTYRAINVGGNNSNLKNASALPEGLLISGNVVRNSAKHVTRLQLNSNPANNDTLKIGALTYLIKTSPSGIYEIQRGASSGITATNIANHLHQTETDGGIIGLYASNPEDVVAYSTDSELLINTTDSIYFYESSSAIVVEQLMEDYTDNIDGISVVGSIGPVLIVNNIIENAGGIEVFYCLQPIVRGNMVFGNFSLKAFNLQNNIKSVFTHNQYAPKFGSAAFRADLLDFMPYVKDNIGFTQFEFAYEYANIGFGSFSKTAPGDGKARMVLFPGEKASGLPVHQNKLFYWDEGDQVKILRNDTVMYTFTMTYGTLGANKFSTGEELRVLIDNTSELVATDLKASITTDPIYISTASTGTFGNNYEIQVTTDSHFNGVVLNGGQFVGGAASASETIFFCPYATNFDAPTIAATNSFASSLSGIYVDLAGSSAGNYYKIKHSVAAGTEQFIIKL